MAEMVLAESRLESNGRYALVTDDGQTAWLYLHSPGDDVHLVGKVEATAFVHNRIEPIEVAEVQTYKPGPPPIAKGYGSDRCVCQDSEFLDWTLHWALDGETVLVCRNDEPWALCSVNDRFGMSKAICLEGPWGSPWSDAVFQMKCWN